MVDDIENTLKKYLPAEVIGGKTVKTEEKAFSPLSLDKARSAGLNVDAGIGYACGEEDFYLELLSDYAEGAAGKSTELTSYLDNGDLKNYEILVHSLKSSSRTIGADALSEQAKALEAASKNNDMDYVKGHHDEFVRAFKELAEKISG